MAAENQGQAWAVLAASEMGKGVWLKGWLRREKPRRLLIWDRNDEYDAHATLAPTLAAALDACRAQRFAVRYVPRAVERKALQAEFEAFCTLAIRLPGCTVVVEELADVTTASHAPAAWGQLNTRGRHHAGLHIIACSQSPAWVDKRFLANATFLHIGYLGSEAHRRAVAQEMDVSPDDIKALAQFDYIEYRKATKELSRGRVRLPARRG